MKIALCNTCDKPFVTSSSRTNYCSASCKDADKKSSKSVAKPAKVSTPQRRRFFGIEIEFY